MKKRLVGGSTASRASVTPYLYVNYSSYLTPSSLSLSYAHGYYNPNAPKNATILGL
ncbi:hypothetical protein MCHI_000135 [Candidatus Magnetoovum chiemensis]|nr:hypothetical protein MCHI_000135 [Candidatus Magnetoovum chiemensis]